MSTLYKHLLKLPRTLSKNLVSIFLRPNTLVYCIPLTGLSQWLRGSQRCRRYGFNSWVEKIPWRRHGHPPQYSCWRIHGEDPGSLQPMGGDTEVWTWQKQLSMHTGIPVSKLQSCICVKVRTWSESPWFLGYPSIVDHQCLSQRSSLTNKCIMAQLWSGLSKAFWGPQSKAKLLPCPWGPPSIRALTSAFPLHSPRASTRQVYQEYQVSSHLDTLGCAVDFENAVLQIYVHGYLHIALKFLKCSFIGKIFS